MIDTPANAAEIWWYTCTCTAAHKLHISRMHELAWKQSEGGVTRLLLPHIIEQHAPCTRHGAPPEF